MAEIPTFTPGEVVPDAPRELIPDGWYAARVVSSEMTETAKSRESGLSNGFMLTLALEFDEAHHPELRGRMVWERLNIVNPNETAVKIAKKTLAQITESVGITEAFSDSEALHLKPLAVKIGTRPASGSYEAQNEPKGYAPLSKVAGSSATRAPAQASAPMAPPQRW
jgi:hypothetical protein